MIFYFTSIWALRNIHTTSVGDKNKQSGKTRSLTQSTKILQGLILPVFSSEKSNRRVLKVWTEVDAIIALEWDNQASFELFRLAVFADSVFAKHVLFE